MRGYMRAEHWHQTALQRKAVLEVQLAGKNLVEAVILQEQTTETEGDTYLLAG